ncbi:hypothetical protein GCM10010182_65860 [Actinomadura cremea]|nr:hypothetical protein GCM10010182_65860 [Actinomadura cremea]
MRTATAVASAVVPAVVTAVFAVMIPSVGSPVSPGRSYGPEPPGHIDARYTIEGVAGYTTGWGPAIMRRCDPSLTVRPEVT